MIPISRYPLKLMEGNNVREHEVNHTKHMLYIIQIFNKLKEISDKHMSKSVDNIETGQEVRMLPPQSIRQTTH